MLLSTAHGQELQTTLRLCQIVSQLSNNVRVCIQQFMHGDSEIGIN